MSRKRKDRGAFDSDQDDGVVERDEREDKVDLRGTLSLQEARSLRAAYKPPVNSGWSEGDVVGCPDKSKTRETDDRTRGTVFMLFGSEALVLGHDGHMHRVWVTELTAA